MYMYTETIYLLIVICCEHKTEQITRKTYRNRYIHEYNNNNNMYS